jgi:hypothetical protein
MEPENGAWAQRGLFSRGRGGTGSTLHNTSGEAHSAESAAGEAQAYVEGSGEARSPTEDTAGGSRAAAGKGPVHF